jgi:hypothetical protein
MSESAHHDRLARWARRAVVLIASWPALLIAHETGHVIHAVISGGHVVRVTIDSAGFTRTDVDPNPHPLFVAWGGPVWGAVLPLLCWALACVAGAPRWRSATGFLAGLCLVANGSYLASALVAPVGDTEDLLRFGAPRWILAGLGIPMAIGGLWLWHR